MGRIFQVSPRPTNDICAFPSLWFYHVSIVTRFLLPCHGKSFLITDWLGLYISAKIKSQKLAV